MISFDGMKEINAMIKIGTTQKKIAEDMGIREIRYSHLMTGKFKPSYKELESMCKYFGCRIQDLMEYREG